MFFWSFEPVEILFCFLVFEKGALLELHDVENGIEALKRSLLLSPNDPVVLINGSYFMMLSGRYKETLDLIKRYDELTNGTDDDDGKLNKEVNKFFRIKIRFYRVRFIG